MGEATLLFKHLPSELSMAERKDLLHHLGATRVQVMSRGGSMKNTAFAVFPSKEEASKIVKQLHQVEFLGSKLKVEFAHKDKPRVSSVVDNEGLENKTDTDQETSKNKDKDELKQEPKEIKFDETFHTWGIKHQRRPDLCYLYPPPTPSTLTNIMHALAAVPKFYVQVLHLMNKMDLPAPFGAVTSAPPVHPDIRGYLVIDDAVQQEMDISSETESELESDEEERNKRSQDKVQVKRPLTKKSEHRRKRPRLTDLQDSLYHQPDAPSGEAPSLTDVFEQALSEHVAASRRIELKLPSTKLPLRGSQPPLPPPLPPMYHPPTLSVAGGTVHQSHALQAPSSMAGIISSEDQVKVQENRTADQSKIGEREPHGPLLPPSLVAQSKQTAATTSLLQQQQQPDADNPYDVPLPPMQAGTQEKTRPTEPTEPQIFQHPESEAAPVPAGQRDEPQAPRAPNEHQEDEVMVGGFGILQPQPQTKEASSSEEDTQEKEWTKSKFISSSQLKRSRLSHSEMKEYSVFRRYNEGDPSCRLYIKNLAKQVTEEDIHWIFGRYVDWDDPSEKDRFDIRLMKEGRMKGQAFVAFPSEEAASSALKDTNGFMLKEKPMVVQFARSAKAQDDTSSKP